MLLKEIADGALAFAGSSSSRKGRDLAVNRYAAAVFHWRETLQQVRVTGIVDAVPADVSDAVPADVSDALFTERPRAAQAAVIVSAQSDPLDDETALHERALALVDSGKPLTRPQSWTGYRLVPDEISRSNGSASPERQPAGMTVGRHRRDSPGAKNLVDRRGVLGVPVTNEEPDPPAA